MSRILWFSNAPHANTGYGNQTDLFSRLIKKDHEITISAYYGLEGAALTNDAGITILPRFVHPYGLDIVDQHAQFTKAEMLISLADPFVFNPEVCARWNWVAWTPIDGEPIFPKTAQALRSVKQVWAMSKFGYDQLEKEGFKNISYVPHGINVDVFKPIDRREARQKMAKTWKRDLNGKFVIVSVAANKGEPSRKGFFEMFASFAEFCKIYPDSILYVHTEVNGVWNGEYLPAVAELAGVDPQKLVYAPQFQMNMGMLGNWYLNDVYNTADIYLTTSHGEGFGIPIVEAQAAGCPVIVTDFSSMPELCFSGWRVPGIPFMPASGYTQKIPLIPYVVESLKGAYEDTTKNERRNAVHLEAQHYSHLKVYDEFMKPAIEKALNKPTNRAERRRQKRLERAAK